VNVVIKMNGQDVTDDCLLSATRIAYDTSKRITTASLTIMGAALARTAGARYDAAHYDVDRFSAALSEMFVVQIFDGRDGVTKLFDGQIYAMTLVQSDAPTFGVFYQCDLNDWAAWLDRAVCWNRAFPVTMPNSDKGIIEALLGQFCPKIHLTDIAEIVPIIQKFDWATKTCRQVLDELSALSMGQWRVDFDANLHYELASDAPAAPFGLSTSPDMVTSFPVRVDGYRHDFTNPVNHAYVRGTQDPTTGVTISAEYSDPVSIQTYGEYSAGFVDEQIVTGWDAALRAKSMVLQNAYPIETGNFTIWGRDGLRCGMQVHLVEENIGIDGDYIIRALAMEWIDADTVQYTAQFGAAQADLETILRMLDQRTKWKTSNVPVSVATPGPPPDGSVTDASIAPPGLSSSSIASVSASAIQGTINASQIGSVNASTIQGTITSSQIGSVNASTIIGQITSTQIASVNANQIAGSITASQIGSVNATAIQGSITSAQIGSISASKITGSIAADQIGGVWANTIAGQIQSSQIGSVNAAAINGSISAGQIGSVNASTINGVIVTSQLANQIIDDLAKYADALRPIPMLSTAADLAVPSDTLPPNSFFYWIPDGNFYQMTPDGMSWTPNNSPQNARMKFYNLGAMNAGSIVGLIVAAQIGSITAGQITGAIQAAQIASLTAGQITGQLSAAQIATVNATAITGTITAAQIQSITSGQITGALSAAQIGSVNASTIVGSITAAQISTVNATAIQGSITSAQIASIAADKISGSITAGQIASVNATAISGTITAAQIGTIAASQVSGTFAYTQIGSVNAATITIGLVGDSQISGMSGAKLTVGTVNSDKLNTTSIDVGGGGSKPGKINVYNGSSTMVAELGAISTGQYGGWFKQFGAGGTSYSNAKVSTDSSGNLSITDATFTINGTGSRVVTSPSTFDSTYASIQLIVESNPALDKTSMISRGLVFYYNSTKIGAIVRSPSGGWMELVWEGAGYVLISGKDGVRSDGGFSVSGAVGVSGSFTSANGKTITVTKGIVTSIA